MLGYDILRINQENFHFQTTKADTLEKLDPFNVKEMAMLSSRIILKVANDKNLIIHRKNEDEILQIIKSNNLDDFLKLTKMHDIFFPWPKKQ